MSHHLVRHVSFGLGVDVFCCKLYVVCLTGKTLFCLEACVARSIETTFVILSPSIVMVCDIVSVI